MSVKQLLLPGTLVLFLNLQFLISNLHSQERIESEIHPAELVSIDRTIPLKTALIILGTYAIKYEGKMIIDPEDRENPIGVMVNNMYWKTALEYILRSNLLAFKEHEQYYAVIPLTEATAQAETITQTTREVEIKAIFFEADYGTLAEAGVDWSVIKNGKVRVNGNFGSEVTQDLFSVQVNESSGLWDIFGLLKFFETQNKGEIISNPQIKVMDGEEGKIKVGTNFFLTTRDFAGNTRFTEYESGTILSVRPQVIGEADSLFIHLDIRAERSSVSPAEIAVTKSITESKTQVLLVNGEQTVIAGLFSHDNIHIRKGIPILKDLPPWFFGLRYLFGYSKTQTDKKELIIILKATVVPSISERFGKRSDQRDLLREQRYHFEKLLRQLKKQIKTD